MSLLSPGLTKHSSNFTGSETAANLNSGNAKTVTVKAKWKSNCNDGLSSVGSYKNFDYTGSVQTFNACAGRTYKLEVWGAQGNYYSDTSRGGYGGYAYGLYNSVSNGGIYVVVGGGNSKSTSGSYNGGGNSSSGSNTGGGGGATHISTYNCGVLNNCTSYKSSILIVAGGGGGEGQSDGHPYNYGAPGGGFKTPAVYTSSSYCVGSTQTSGGQGFGLGGNASGTGNGGGGGGWYGGCGPTNAGATVAGGGGTGYIGNSLLLTDKKMYMYNYSNSAGESCTQSTATDTYTICTSSTGAHVANRANTGNGYAKITYLGT